MEGLLEEGKEVLDEDGAPAVKDAGIIGAAQKVEHYEISAYGTAKSMASITRQLYETYRPESDGVTDASVNTVVTDAVAMLQQVNRQSKATVDVDTSGAPGVVRVPAGLLRQAVYNLVQNAVEASPKGGTVWVTAAGEDGM